MSDVRVFPKQLAHGPTEEDRDFAGWVAAHRSWRRRLSEFIMTGSGAPPDDEIIRQAEACSLGKWIEGSGNRHYGKLPAFRQLRASHADFHKCAGKVLAIYKREGQPAAARALHTEFDLLSLEVIESLESLERVVKGLPS